MQSLLFLPNEWLNPALEEKYRVPLTFVRFGYTEGYLYRLPQARGRTFLATAERRVSHSIVYGGIFHLRDEFYFQRVLDAYFACSLSTLHVNHPRDMQHRVTINVTPIGFDNLSDLGRCIYHEEEVIRCQAYFGNPTHAKIAQRLKKTAYRVPQGIDKTNFIKRFREEENEKS